MNESARLEAKSRSSIQNQPVPSAGLDSVDRTHGDPEENVHGPSRLNEVQSSDRSPFSKTECSREIFLLKELRGKRDALAERALHGRFDRQRSGEPGSLACFQPPACARERRAFPRAGYRMKPSFVRRLSPQAFVGHLVLSGSRSEGGPPTMGFGDDWR